jgi:uncharacterized protein
MTDFAPAPPSPPPNGAGRLLEKVFLGPSGLRAGWRLLVFVTLAALVLLIAGTLLGLIYHPAVRPSAGLTEAVVLVGEVPMLLSIFAAAFIMGKIERRSFSAYGLPLREVFGARFWEGAAWGFAAISALVAVLAGLHALSLGPAGLGWGHAVTHGLAWAGVFLVVAFFEEFGFRGYALATLTDGIGYWPAAVLMSMVFGAVHRANSGETAAGLIEVFLTGLFLCLTLRRSGSLWFGIGLHAAWDWGESFFYGVPDSGQVVRHHLLAGTSHGPAWLSGGVTGPEGSVLALGLVVILAVFASRRFREARFPPSALPAEQSR